MKSLATLLLITAAWSFTGCATRPAANQGLELMSVAEYEKVVDRHTQRSQKYSGLYNTMDVTATLVNTAVAKAQLEQKARLLQWDRAQFQLESNKLAEKNKNETEVFLSFFTPDKKNDDLQKKTTQWRVYLEADGRRWEGKTMKIRQPIAEIQGLFSYHSRFSTPYLITFPVGTATIDPRTTRFIVTGPIDIVTLEYAPAAPSASAP
ncbi:MAG: hypothetical protein KF865_01215 [Bdellovibrionaceae bacterium]|nr:hypothetical protein [Pseudobdellovibrionaceae bacterium]